MTVNANAFIWLPLLLSIVIYMPCPSIQHIYFTFKFELNFASSLSQKPIVKCINSSHTKVFEFCRFSFMKFVSLHQIFQKPLNLFQKTEIAHNLFDLNVYWMKSYLPDDCPENPFFFVQLAFAQSIVRNIQHVEKHIRYIERILAYWHLAFSTVWLKY